MDLLFKREQSKRASNVHFKLWAKVELDMQEASLVRRYDFDDAVLISVLEPDLLRRAIMLGIAVFLASAPLVWLVLKGSLGVLFVLGIGPGVGFWYYDAHRETIYVRDLMHGRHFKCNSVIELARKEAWLATVVSYLRQVMESAKHWDGTEHYQIEPLPKEEARLVMLRGL